ncbi:low temperature requirement protein A [Micromonospora musae]|uniref:Low temperature requirement protein A n=1 Tax=Micromonospora musae TaxID=1894970 RepID=A0A3A9Y8K6_9ACTN|nr:low temperature requirement protein A [Micromonospora musae]RKN22187.1 low temperature requirement protein A [Micromonospora musae]RKN33950.1 low temperature requirement protein A [Micromonospora musae]
MAAGRGAALLRAEASSGRATFLELFFDLAFVVALTRVSQRFADVSDETGWALVGGLGRTLLLFLALWLIWSQTTWITSRYEPERSIIQAVVIGTMFAALVMAVTLPRAVEERAVPFTVAYLMVMVVRPLVVAAALRGHPRRLVPFRLAAWSALSAPLWLVGALGPDRLRLSLWAAALAVDYLAWALGWPLPRLGAAAVGRWRITGEHLAERHQQIFLIALGESILVIGAAFGGVDYSAERAAAFGIAFITSAVLWRIYFHRAGRLLNEALGRAGLPGQLGTASERTHALIVLSVLVTAVGYELVIAQPFGPPRPTWLLFVVGGPVLFLLARIRLDYEIFGRVPRSRVIGLVVLLLVTTALARWSPMVGLSVVAGVLALIALVDALRSRQRPLEDLASPIARETPGNREPEA